MSTYEESQHDRTRDGKYAEMAGSAPESVLTAPAESAVSDHPEQSYADSGGVGSTEDSAILGALRVTEAISAVSTRLPLLTEEQRTQLGERRSALNEGAWGDLSERAWFSIRRIDADEATWASMGGRDGSDLHVVNPNRAAAEAVYDDEFYRTRNADLPDSHYAAMSAAHDAAVALTHRWKIGRSEYPGWTQEAYDHLTRPWREVIGSLQPDDEARPGSWDARPLHQED